LKSVREKITAIDKKIAESKEIRLSEIAGLYGLDFNHRDFLVVNEVNAANFSSDLLYKEVYDHTSLLVKPIFPASYFELYREKDELLKKERGLEQNILTHLSEEVHKNKVKIEQDIQTIELLDVLFAKARIAIKYLMVKPDLNNAGGCISIVKGRFLPLLNKCRELGTEYIPLSVSFDRKTIVISGSNMGGKTVLLKSLGFFQLLAQMGFWVPADSFDTSIFERIVYIGNDENQAITGLSSFGFEIHQLSDVFSQLDTPSFLLIDELARTTNSTEAKSLISAILKSFAGKKTVNCFLSTHMMGLPEFQGVSFYKMKGFNHDEYKKTDMNHQQQTLNERIRLINSFMQYEVVKENQAEKSSDAILVAELLGLDKELIEHAKNYLEGNYG
jgi:DNA mismatch repair ATPase MutS